LKKAGFIQDEEEVAEQMRNRPRLRKVRAGKRRNEELDQPGRDGWHPGEGGPSLKRRSSRFPQTKVKANIDDMVDLTGK